MFQPLSYAEMLTVFCCAEKPCYEIDVYLDGVCKEIDTEKGFQFTVCHLCYCCGISLQVSKIVSHCFSGFKSCNV